MRYSYDEINLSNRIFYYLLKNGSLDDSQEDLYKAYSDNESITYLVKGLGEAAECEINKYGGVVYVMPKEENDFLGYSKNDLKKELCKSNANDKDYYLSQFIILTLLVNFYGSQGISSNSRDYMRVGELLNIISDRLNEGISKAEEDTAGINYSDLLERYEALRSSEKKSSSKTTKEGFVNTILGFLEKQGLIDYIKADETIKTTGKLNSFMDWNLLNKNNYNRVLKALGENIDE
ncbi:hypothetical protein SAMN02745196_01207 [Clostridium collagenovorans DSM 3089]|uniref:Uncharacterized protein n=1 Tax=Clostridium collagenovorans DSM 3089 TaxID=1121306 RepID=A0A1M5VB98_9CLOT|nr:DUF6063 family protein [Clostridium collagenovorans]SHH72476.1 hypothetical protein SAMN02745196_01207 [Clostridium collagenovorans DSM 3089]